MLNQSGEVTRLAVKDAVGFPAISQRLESDYCQGPWCFVWDIKA